MFDRMRFATFLLASAIWSGCAPRCVLIDVVPDLQGKQVASVEQVDPVDHVTDVIGQSFVLFGRDIDAGELDVAFWGRRYSHVADARTVRITSEIKHIFALEDIADKRYLGARHNVVHEAWHVVQSQGRSRLAWWWYYIWRADHLEREADAMALRYREVVR